jgi:hypothetical protein
MRRVTIGAVWILSALTACGSSDGGSVDSDAAATAGDGAATDAPLPAASACPAGQFATGLDDGGRLECAPIDAAALAAVDEHCAVLFGWSAACGACTSDPTRWGRVTGTSCANGIGANGTCTSATLDGVDVEMYGLNTASDVADDDKFYLGWSCAVPDDTPSAGPCPAGTFVSALAPVECVTARAAIAGYAHESCAVYAGWIGACDGCTTAPAQWGRASGEDCANGLGAEGTCTTPTLGDTEVHLFGFSPDGDVDGDDKFHVGFQCAGASAADGLVDRACPDGQLVVAVEEDGQVRCASPLPAAEAALQTGCHLYLGWRGDCTGCDSEPAKWGRVSHDACEVGVGADDTCSATELGDATVELFGLSTDGDVDDNDKFYVGFTCE